MNYALDVPAHDVARLDPLEPFRLSVAEAYEQMLFHGPRFQTITAIEGINERGITATLRPSRPGSLLASSAAERWLIDPVVVDGAFQLAILWMRSHADITPLPSRLGRLSRFGPFEGDAIRCQLAARASQGGCGLETQMWLIDAQDRLVGRIEDMQFNCSRALKPARRQPRTARAPGAMR